MSRMDNTRPSRPDWPEHGAAKMARDFLFWRHLRVVRARTMRHLRKWISAVSPANRPVRTVYDVSMWPNWGDKTYAYCHYGTYGSYLADLLRAVDRPFIFLDIGANQGLFSLIAGQNRNCEAIVALEPVPRTYDLLSRNLTANALDERATALNFGLSDRVGTFPITLSKGHSGLATLGGEARQFRGEHPTTDVKLETMTELAQQIPADLPIFVKVDVEGHEETVIRELLSWDEAERIFGLFYEHDDRWTDKEAVNALLDEAGFRRERKFGRGRHYDVLAAPDPGASA